ncbi:DNA repair helicase, putative [Trypanosoma cruzi]|uniref:DNA 3'-5' helicase n=2 Tax=Trypanosoma cruzi TaxID=5693 RepID=Q4D5K3_TRYCC|nr:DNA repair helicase, putative [Trypanosoma cruzi]EAN87800.1 DNA repair helicase, putative [Trypanosoma cruzi]|eukprot:XP_809651.1 DNA repair helicase [Trypanosoma cruzi strain CL Brener]
MQCLFLEERVSAEGYVVLLAETFRSSFQRIQFFLTTIAEPTSRPSLMHEYRMTPFSLGAAVSASIPVSDVICFLDEYVYGFCDEGENSRRARVCAFLEMCMSRYNLARIVIEDARTFVECDNVETAETLLLDPVVRSLCAEPPQIVPVVPHSLLVLRSRAVARRVAERCVLLGFPLQQQYDYERDSGVRNINVMLKTQTKPRPYQIDAVNAAATEGSLRSGCIVLPCGAGKTLVGIMLLCKVKKPTLILCAGSVSVEQWKNQILEFASICAHDTDDEMAAAEKHRSRLEGAARIACLTGKQKDPVTEETDIVLTTYSMLVTAHRAQMRQRAAHASGLADDRHQKRRRANPKEKLFQPYGLLIMDEVHVMPAEAYKESLSLVDAKGVVGLTATYVREDAKIQDLFHLVGPKLYDVSWETLASSGYLANVTCIEVLTPLTRQFSLEYMQRSGEDHTLQQRKMPLLVMLAAANPNKMLCVLELVRRHVADSSKILVFCDHLLLLREYGTLLHAPVICGQTPHRERLMIFSDFQSTSKLNVICLSRVGDVSVNLPSANVVIQVSSHGGSRRQEAQRLGRILRPKARASNGKMVDAWFYTIISTDTLEMAYAAHRTAFLVDQGYTCRIIEFQPDELSNDETDDVAVAAEAGDAVSLKQEKLRSALREKKLQCESLTVPQGSVDARKIEYQLDLLSRVVSNWELEYHSQGLKQASSGHDGFPPDDDANVSEGRDVMEIVPDSDLAAIKREWAGGTRMDQFQFGHSCTSLQGLVSVDENFVYHEL